MQGINLKKLNTNYASDPNIAEPTIRLSDEKLRLIFPLNYAIFDFKEGEKGIIEFTNCVAFRSGSPNDEGFYRYQQPGQLWSEQNFKDLEWDSFYEVVSSEPVDLSNFYKIGKPYDARNMRRFVFFMKEATFECLAESYKELIPG